MNHRKKKWNIDIEEIFSIRHSCEPKNCNGSCCGCFDVVVDAEEVDRILDYLTLAAKYCKNLFDGDQFINPFEESDNGFFSLETLEDGVCVFFFSNDSGEGLCSLHVAALEIGVEPYEVKPLVCSLWPLAITNAKPYYISIDDASLEFECCHEQASNNELCPNVADIFKKVFGSKVLSQAMKRQRK